jgi:hypothetical protein
VGATHAIGVADLVGFADSVLQLAAAGVGLVTAVLLQRQLRARRSGGDPNDDRDNREPEQM